MATQINSEEMMKKILEVPSLIVMVNAEDAEMSDGKLELEGPLQAGIMLDGRPTPLPGSFDPQRGTIMMESMDEARVAVKAFSLFSHQYPEHYFLIPFVSISEASAPDDYIPVPVIQFMDCQNAEDLEEALTGAPKKGVFYVVLHQGTLAGSSDSLYPAGSNQSKFSSEVFSSHLH